MNSFCKESKVRRPLKKVAAQLKTILPKMQKIDYTVCRKCHY